MKLSIVFASMLFLGLTPTSEAAAEEGVIRLSDPVEVTEEYEVFGSRVDRKDLPVPLSAIISSENDHAGREVFVRATVHRVCRKKGCFFIAQDGDAIARITFKDYSFFIPTDSAGKEVTLVGTLAKTMVSEKRAKHYAEDVGDDPSKEVGTRLEYSIVATSVIIPRT